MRCKTHDQTKHINVGGRDKKNPAAFCSDAGFTGGAGRLTYVARGLLPPIASPNVWVLLLNFVDNPVIAPNF